MFPSPSLFSVGVFNGAVLQVLEPRFNVEALALLLNIPPSKTLLRRHLATHFHLLIGSEAQRLKQDCLENPDYTVLTATAKVKVTPPSAASRTNPSLLIAALVWTSNRMVSC